MLLAMDTATPYATVALLDEGGDPVAERRAERPGRHAAQLAPLVGATLAAAGLVRQDVTALAVGVGPGLRTGVGVGLATARALALALDLPVYGVCTLDVLALEAALGGDPPGTDFAVVVAASRGEVHLATYDDQGRRLEGPRLVRVADAATDGPVVGAVAGPGAASFPGLRGPGLPSATWLARAVSEELAELHDPEPLLGGCPG